MELTSFDLGVQDLVIFAAGRGHDEYPCLSRYHSLTSCIPCKDFSPWVAERVRRQDVEAVGESLWRLREANPGPRESPEEIRRRYDGLAQAVMAAELATYLKGGSEQAYADLRVTLVLLAAHETFTGFIMTGEAAHFVAAVMAPHPLELVRAQELVEQRNRFVETMAGEMSYWASWPPLAVDDLRAPTPPADPPLQDLLALLAELPLGTRAHAVDTLRHLAVDPPVPRPLAVLGTEETRKRGLDIAESTRRILETGLVVPASDVDAWLRGWTRRDLLRFLTQSGLAVRNSWSKERLAEVAKRECAELLNALMVSSAAVELAPTYREPAHGLKAYLQPIHETWAAWLGFGTGIQH